MHRDPRFADIERLVGSLTASIAVGSMIPWPSRLLTELTKYGLDMAWTALFAIVGVGMVLSSRLHDLYLRAALAWLAALLWLIFIVAAWVLKMPVLLASSAIMVWTCVRVARTLREGDSDG